MILTLAAALLGCNGDVPVDTPTPTVTTPAPVQPPDTVPEEGPPVVEAYLAGRFDTLPAYEGAADVSGAAMLVKYLNGTTGVSVALSGLTPSTEHSVHVHVWPCASLAGGHYKLDPGIEDTVAENEIWPNVTTDAEGNGTSWLSVDHWTRGDALSVIVHDPVTNDKLACTDLLPSTSVGSRASGSFAPFADYQEIDQAISGTAEVVMSSTTTTVSVNVQGLDDASSYSAHVHALPCDVLYAGGHYKIDPSIDVADAANELWPEVVPSGGVAQDTLNHPTHALREDAQSIVIHRDGPKVACADLTRESYIGLRTYGEIANLPGADARGIVVGGSALMHRRMDGITVVELDVTGLPPNAEHPVHVHDKPCDVAEGGAHYFIDPAGPEGVENEIWPNVVANASGAGSRTLAVEHLARAEAQSLVIHDGADNARLACVDLY